MSANEKEGTTTAWDKGRLSAYPVTSPVGRNSVAAPPDPDKGGNDRLRRAEEPGPLVWRDENGREGKPPGARLPKRALTLEVILDTRDDMRRVGKADRPC